MTGWEDWIIANTLYVLCKYRSYYLLRIFEELGVSIFASKLPGVNDTPHSPHRVYCCSGHRTF